VEAGWWLPPDAEAIVRLGDEAQRLEAWRRAARPVAGGFLVPPEALEWLLKQAAELRRREAAGG